MINFLGSGLLSWISGLFGKLFDYIFKFFFSFKVMLFGMYVVVLSAVLKNVVVWVFEEIIEVASSELSGLSADGIESSILNLSGATGYLAYHLMLPDCISILLTAIIIRFTLNFIPFVG